MSTWRDANRAVLALLFVALAAGLGAQQQWTHEISDGTLWVRIDQARGGVITDLQVRAGETRRRAIVDNGDRTGRQIQASLYRSTYDAACFPCRSACFWGWNPVQAGNACQQPSSGSVLQQSGLRIVSTVVPQQWNDRLGRSNILVQQTLDIVKPFVLSIEYRVTNNESFTWGDVPHELPVVYLQKGFAVSAYAYTGPEPFTYGAAALVSVPATALATTEPWIAWSDTSGLTLALYVPGKYSEWALSTVGDANVMQAWQPLRLSPGETGSVRAFLVAGATLTEARMRIYMLDGR